MTFRWVSAGVMLAVGVWLLGMATGHKMAVAQEKDKPPLERPRPLPGNAEARGESGHGQVPNESQLYVWPVPEQGTQTLIVLRVIDGDTAEAAYLVPVVLRIKGINAPELRDKGGKDAREALDKLVGGKLLPANLFGREKYGRVLAEFWLGKEQGWLSEAMVKGGWVKKYEGGPRD
jgi:endonuclease YncB( thermonuclease family)